MTSLTPHQTTEIQVFEPQKAKVRDAQADAVIDYAKRLKDWSLLEAAIEQKLEDQRLFVEWWRATVTPNRAHKRNDSTVISVSDAEQLTGITVKQVSRWDARLREPDKYRALLLGALAAKAMQGGNDTTALKWTGDPESYTPAKYIESARIVLGEIDMDPASNPHAQQTVRAYRWFGIEQDGLMQTWAGRVFLNPPYAFPAIANFIEKLCSEIDDMNVSAAILLTNNNTDTQWWHRAAIKSQAICCTAGRINFYKADGSETQPTNGQTFFYFGENIDAFREEFSMHGLILQHV